MRHCAIWYYLYNLNNGKNTHGGILLLVKVTLLHECFRRLENSTNRIKSRKALQIITTRYNSPRNRSYFFLQGHLIHSRR